MQNINDNDKEDMKLEFDPGQIESGSCSINLSNDIGSDIKDDIYF